MRPAHALVLSTLLAFALVTPAWAAGFFHQVRDPLTLKECGACHMVYPPVILPKRSWATIMGSLADHFGEDATLGEASRTAILAYLSANAADASGNRGRWFQRGVRPTDVPLRITDMPFWRAIHGRFPPGVFRRQQVGAKSNCVGCHG